MSHTQTQTDRRKRLNIDRILKWLKNKLKQAIIKLNNVC